MRGSLAATGFYLVSAILFPITALGHVIWVGQGLLTWGRSTVSGTAQGPLSARGSDTERAWGGFAVAVVA